MKSINEKEELWTSITVESLENREEYTSLTSGCCVQFNCCIDISCCIQLHN